MGVYLELGRNTTLSAAFPLSDPGFFIFHHALQPSSFADSEAIQRLYDLAREID